MLPHERSLVERMEDEPFVLIGVNSDPDFQELKQKEFIDERIAWRSFTDFRLDPETKKLRRISEDWKVNAWPTLFLIDADGRFRRMWRGAPASDALDRAIDELIAETKANSDARRSGARTADR